MCLGCRIRNHGRSLTTKSARNF
uniref:Uncharacterized protein n=1 Tax=Anguilla anguilla TaxID=7936 RepID=A0A0E9S8J9_ANGAN